MIHWFFSKTVREARAMRRHVMRLVNAQRDLLSADAIRAIIAKIAELDAAIGEGARGKIRIKTEELQFTTEKWIKPYPNPLWRENVEVLLVALAVAMGIRTFFLQPFKIPTASMQPTLYGVTSVPDYDKVINAIGAFDRLNGTISADEIAWCRAKIKSDMAEQQALEKNLVIPTGWKRVKQWFEGISYLHVVAQHDGALERID
ncbi:MAG: S26 family signal peptidase, partial [Verrucomicrobia bacterium]|nr:S26 family signal peptidase [Verrucomicrobiota bacterium]